MKVFSRYLFAILLINVLFLVRAETSAQITHDISKASLTIPSTSTSNYIITGNTTYNSVIVTAGYFGTITLRNVKIELSGTYSPIAIKGKNNCSNLTPVSNVYIILEGTNILTSYGSSGCAALQVEQGAQINISAINPSDNSSGTLNATVTNTSCGAGIGALIHSTNPSEATADAVITGGCYSPGTTAGGNIIISSGIITAQGGHGAGIGGGYTTYYDGMIVIYGGIINSSTIRHAAGIGSGCPNGHGVESCYTPNSSIIVLPPSQISATGAGSTSYLPISSLALAGANDIIYIGDPAKPLISVHTQDNEPKAEIYADLSQDPSISKVINALIPKNRLDLNQVKLGTTNSTGNFQFNGILQNSTTFYTNAYSSNPATLGRPYLPEKVILPMGGIVVLKLLQTNLALIPFHSSALDEYFTVAQASKKSYRVKLVYSDSVPLNNVVIDLANGSNSDFESIHFYAADSITPISQPTTLNSGNIIYISMPIKTGKMIGEYTDVLRIIGTWNGYTTGYIRQVIKQTVIHRIYATICEGNKYYFKNTYLTQNGIYMDTLVSSHKTDSIIALNLTVNPIKRNTILAKICSNEFYNFHGKQYNQTGIYNDTLTSVNGCDSIVKLQLTVNPAYKIYKHLTIWDNQLPYAYTDTIFKSGTKTRDYIIYRKTVNSCDSITTLSLKVLPTFHAEIKPIPTICGDDPNFLIEYGITYGSVDWQSVIFDSKAHSAGFTDITRQPATGASITVQLPPNILPEVYTGTVILENNETYTEKSQVVFTINYPSSIILQKWNDVLALLNSSYNGGYEFSSYQWYKNEIMIPGETKSYLYIKTDNLDMNSKYSVAVTRVKDGVKSFTCSISPTLHTDIKIYPTLVPKSDNIDIKMDNAGKAVIWNISGLKVMEQTLQKGENTIIAPGLTGTYLLEVITEQGEVKKQLIIVK